MGLKNIYKQNLLITKNMKKATILVLLLALSLSLSACGKKKAVNNIMEAQKVEQKGLMAWLKGGTGTECIMKAPEGDMIIKTQDGKTRIEGMGTMVPSIDPMNPEPPSPESQMGITVYNGDWMYMWSGDKGTKMNQKKMEALGEELGEDMEEDSAKDWTEIVGDMEEMDIAYDCKPKKFAASEFEAPENVEFQDLTEMFEQMAEMGKQMQESMEGGDFDPNSMPDMNEMMKGM